MDLHCTAVCYEWRILYDILLNLLFTYHYVCIMHAAMSSSLNITKMCNQDLKSQSSQMLSCYEYKITIQTAKL